METKTIVYIVLGIGWFLFKNWRKKNSEQNAPQEVEEQADVRQYDFQEEEKSVAEQEPQQPKGFEELIGEFLGEPLKPKVQPVPKIIETPAYMQEIVSEKQPVQKVVIDDEEEFERFDKFKIQEEETEDYSEMFASSDSIRKAFVANEIFAKKY